MRRTVLPLAIALASLSTAVPAGAQERAPRSSHEEAAAELVEVLRLEELTTASIQVTMESLLAQNPGLAEYRDVFAEFFQEYARWEELAPEYVRIYAEAYTEAELRELVAFYRTPLGRKTVELMPRLMQEGAEVGRKQIEPHLPELERRILQRAASGGR